MFGLSSAAMVSVEARYHRASRRLREAKEELEAAQREFAAASRALDEYENPREPGGLFG